MSESTADIDALEAGPVTDALVCDALHPDQVPKLFRTCYRDDAGVLKPIPAFSRNWGPAMEAAEEAGLFRRWRPVQSKTGTGWGMTRDGEKPGSGGYHVGADTGPLAVCKAILVDAENRKESEADDD